MQRNINQVLAERIRIPSFHLYQLEFIKPFVDAYLEHPEKTKYKLFHKYIFRPDLFIDTLLQRGVSSKEMFLKDGRFNTKNKDVKYELDHHMEVFIGYRKIGRSKCPFFLSIRPWNYNYIKRTFSEITITGFSTQTKDDWSNYFDEHIELEEIPNYDVKFWENDLHGDDNVISKLMIAAKKLKK